MAEADPDHTPEVAAAPRPRRKRGALFVLFHSVRGLVLLALVPVIVLALAPVLMIGQEITAPSWIKTRVEAQAARTLNGGALRFGAITVEVGRDLHPQVRIHQAELRDAAGSVLARVPQIGVGLSPRGLLFNREVLPQTITLTGPQVALRRAADGTVEIAFESSAAPAGRADSLPELIEVFDAALATPALAALEAVRAEGVIVNYEDARAGRSWTVDGGAVDLVLSPEQSVLTGDFALLSGRDFITTMTLRIESDRASPAARIAVEVEDALADDIASQSPALSWLGLIDARMSARLEGSLDAEGALGPLRADLSADAGALRPARGASPVAFEQADVRMAFDPQAGRIRFDEVAVVSEWGAVTAQGHADLTDVTNGLPATLIGQFDLRDIALDPPGLYAEPLLLEAAGADFRLRLEPFDLEVGAFHVIDRAPVVLARAEADGPDAAGVPSARLDGRARISADAAGWRVAVDAGVDKLSVARLLALWPESVRPGTRLWFVNNVEAAVLTGSAGGIRLAPGQEAPVWALTSGFLAADVRVLGHLPLVRAAAGTVTLQDNSLTVALEEGRMTAPDGGAVALAGTVFRIPDTRIPQPPANLSLRTDSTITAALSILDQPPWGFISRAGREVTLAQGRARAEGEMAFRLLRREPGQPPPQQRPEFDVTARLTDVRSEVLVPGRVLAASALSLTADEDGMRVAGPMRLGRVAADVAFTTGFGPGSGTARVEGEVTLSEQVIDEFNIGLPPGLVAGSGPGQITLDLGGGPPRFVLTSALDGLRMEIPALGWRKAAGTRGRFEIAGQLGAVPRIDRVALEAAGLTAEGRIVLTDRGGLDRAEFGRVRMGNWLDAPVTLVGRGAGRPVEVRVGGGTLDLRGAAFGGGDGQEGGPLVVTLERLQVTEGLAVTGFRGEFTGAGGFNGRFTGRVNGGAEIRGAVAPGGGGTAVRIQSDQAGEAIASAGLVQNGVGGALDLSLIPAAAPGTFDGRLRITDLRVRDAPALAQLIDAISVVGLLQQLDGQGLSFTEVNADFRIAPERITVRQASAVGPGLGISADGIYAQGSRRLDFQGVISPIYLINGVGAGLTRPGEGLFGFNYTLRGPVSQPQVSVNPLSILTPGAFREIFRTAPPGGAAWEE